MPAIEYGIPYYIYNNAQTQYFALNSPTDPNFVGYVSDITGLDSPGIRENAQVVVAGDGGYHGPFWKDRRPWTISGFIMPVFPIIARDQAQERLEGILIQCLQQDGFLTWTPADTIQKMLRFRTQQPPRITKGQSNIQRNFQVAGVTSDWRAIAWTQSQVQASLGAGALPLTLPAAQNLGNVDASPQFVVQGPLTAISFTITNLTTGKSFKFNSPALSVGSWYTIDLTGPYPSVTDGGGNNYDGNVDPLVTDWTIAVAGNLTVANGNNVFQLSAVGATVGSVTTLKVLWNHSWA